MIQRKILFFKSRSIISVLLSLLFFCAFLSGCAKESKPDCLEITAMQVGEADSILIQEGDTAILVDTGLKGSKDKILDVLKEKKISHLDYLIITHYDKDHVGSAASLLSQIKTDQILCPDYTGTRDEYIAFRQAAPNRTQIAEITNYSCGNLQFTIYPATSPAPLMAEQKEYDNDLSLVMELDYGTKKFLFTGDIEKRRIAQMLEKRELSDCDWIKIPHHGKYQKSLANLLSATSPAFAVISTSEKNAPADKLIRLLENQNISYEGTMNGDVFTYCDGDKVWMELQTNK